MAGFQLFKPKRVKVVKLNEDKLSTAIIERMKERDRQEAIEMAKARKQSVWNSLSPRLKLRLLQKMKGGNRGK